MASQTNEQAFEAAIEKHLCGISSEEWKKLGETAGLYNVGFDSTSATLSAGVFQGSCRKNHAASLTFPRAGLSGLRVTAAMGVQFRVSPDQRSGCLALAAA